MCDVAIAHARQLLLDVIVDEVDAHALLAVQQTLFRDVQWVASGFVRSLQDGLELLKIPRKTSTSIKFYF